MEFQVTRGSGKSTLLDIISNLKKPLEGQVLVDGKYDLNSDKYDYRQLISYVPQKLFLVDDTIRENILLSRNCDEKFLEQVCKISGVEDFKLKLDEGLQYQIGENASRLSNGQNKELQLLEHS